MYLLNLNFETCCFVYLRRKPCYAVVGISLLCICGSLCHCPSFNLAWMKVPFPFSPYPFQHLLRHLCVLVAISAVLCPPCFKAMSLVGMYPNRAFRTAPCCISLSCCCCFYITYCNPYGR